jgi:hypothetical protein
MVETPKKGNGGTDIAWKGLGFRVHEHAVLPFDFCILHFDFMAKATPGRRSTSNCKFQIANRVQARNDDRSAALQAWKKSTDRE